jgi:hypothetical protein
MKFKGNRQQSVSQMANAVRDAAYAGLYVLGLGQSMATGLSSRSIYSL